MHPQSSDDDSHRERESNRSTDGTRFSGPPMWVMRCTASVLLLLLTGAMGTPLVNGPLIDLDHVVDVKVEVANC